MKTIPLKSRVKNAVLVSNFLFLNLCDSFKMHNPFIKHRYILIFKYPKSANHALTKNILSKL